MHLISLVLLTALPLALSVPLQARVEATPTSTSSATASVTPLTPNQIQTLGCICSAFDSSGLLSNVPAAATYQKICNLYPASTCTNNTSSADPGTSIPVSGGPTSPLGNLSPGSLLTGILGSLPLGAFAKEKRKANVNDGRIEPRQATGSSSGGGLNPGGLDFAGLATGDLGTAAAVISGVTQSAPGVLSTVGQVASLTGLGGALARDESSAIVTRDAEPEEKRQDSSLGNLAGPIQAAAGGLLPSSNPVTSAVTGLTGSLTGLTGSANSATNPLSGVTSGLTGLAGGLAGSSVPIVGSGGLSGLSELTPAPSTSGQS